MRWFGAFWEVFSFVLWGGLGVRSGPYLLFGCGNQQGKEGKEGSALEDVGDGTDR